MFDRVLQYLADRMGVEPAKAGEALSPSLLIEQPWPQWQAILIGLGGLAIIVAVYRREKGASAPYRTMLAGLRFLLLLLAMLMMSEVVLSVERTGLPYFLVLADDSASGQVVDQYADAKERETAAELTKLAGKAEPNRLAVAQGWLARDDARFLKTLQPDHKIKLYLLSAAAQPLVEIDKADEVAPAVAKFLAAEPNGTQSRLGDGVEQVLSELRGVLPSAILILTDGQTTDGESLAQAADVARRKGVPLYTIGLGDPEPPRDLELSDLLVDEVVFVDDLVRFQAKLSGRGFDGQEVVVRLLELPKGSKDKAQAREIARSNPVKIPPDGQPARFEIPHRPKETGEVTYLLDVDDQPRELRTDNNRIERTVAVRKDKLKILFAEGQPRYEFRYLKEFFRREETTEVKVLLQSADREYASQDETALGTFPTTKEDLFNYDVVILGDIDPTLLSGAQMANLEEFVAEKGGGLLFVAGSDFNPSGFRGTPLERLLPIQLVDSRNPVGVGGAIPAFRPELSAEGRGHPIFRFGDDEAQSVRIWNALPELNWYFEAPRKQPAAFVLAEHPSVVGSNGPIPLITYQFLGAGKSMFQAFDDTWLWRRRVGDRFFGRYWLQTVRFLARSKLAGSKQAELTTDRLRYQRQQPIQIRVRFQNPGLAPADDSLSVQVERSGQSARKVPLKRSAAARHIYEGVLPPTSEGEYTVKLLPPPVLEGELPTTQFRVDPPAGEFERVQMNQSELIRVAEISDGKFYTPATTSSLLDDLPKPRKVPLDTDPPIPLWSTWPVLVIFLTVLTLEWVMRKRKQMI